MTQLIKIIPGNIDYVALKKCADLLKKGKLVVLPTETVYGLGANALDQEAVEGIFKAKGRPPDNPLIVHVSDYEILQMIVKKIPKNAVKLMEKFWPGPLTIIFEKKEIIPRNVTCELNTVAIRMPSNMIAIELIRLSGVPIAAPSANISGNISCTSAADAMDELNGKVDAIIDGGDCDLGLESTVVDVTSSTPHLLRPGAVTLEQLKSVLGKVDIANPDANQPRCPGMKYRHYAPHTPLILAAADDEAGITAKIEKKARQLIEHKKKIAILCSEELSQELSSQVKDNADLLVLCSRKDLRPLAAHIFHEMRRLDKKGYDFMIIGSWPEEGIGRAIMNRLRKAAAKII